MQNIVVCFIFLVGKNEMLSLWLECLQVGLSRLDAALNFFDQMGFKRGRVRKAINGLLKVFGRLYFGILFYVL